MIKDANSDGIYDLQAYPGGPTTIVDVDDNHLCYVGFRSTSNSKVLLDDGAMDVIVKDWRR